MSRISIIGAGFSGLSAAAYLAAAGHEVHVYEKNALAGGRARQLITDNGYTFDMGPSWYWMPEVFENFFRDFGFRASTFYDLTLLDPAFEIVFPDDTMQIPADYQALRNLFESLEPGSAIRLDSFMDEAEYKYKTGIQKLVHKPGFSWLEFLEPELLKGIFRLQVFTSFSKHVRKYFSHPKLIALMEFPVLFLGATPQKTPALYSLMNYAGLKLGTWYPYGGFGSVIDAMMKVAQLNGAKIHLNATVDFINIEDNEVTSLFVNGEQISCEGVIASSDYEHTESKLIDEEYRNYDVEYWDSKTFAPSCLIFYIGVKKKLKNIQHHTLFFDEDLNEHALQIYEKPAWPAKPLFYVCCPSVTDPVVAPHGHENLFILMPLASGLEDSSDMHNRYYRIMMDRLQNKLGEDIESFIDYKKSYCLKDFKEDYNAYKGNAYGLANTLLQTANLKPAMKNKKVKNLFYAGQLTVPGPGVPPSVISGKVAANALMNQLKSLQL